MEVNYGVLSEWFSTKEPVFGHFTEWNTNNAKQVKYFKRVCIFFVFKCDNFHLKSQLCTGGSVVEFSPATREARVRFPASATDIIFSLVKQFFLFFPLVFQFFPAMGLCRSDQKKKKTKKSKQKNHIIQYKHNKHIEVTKAYAPVNVNPRTPPAGT